MKPYIFTLATISSLLLVAACGQSGPLYLPGNPDTVEEIAPASSDKEEQKKDNDGASTR